MWARTTTVYATPSTIERGRDYVHDHVWPVVQKIRGCGGLSLLIDRDSGVGISTTTWTDQATLEASRGFFVPLREGAQQAMRLATPPVSAEWQVASMYRAPNPAPSVCARVTWSHVDHEHGAEAIDWYRFVLLREIEKFPGFTSVSLLRDRNGAGVRTVAFESHEAMKRSGETAADLRERSTSELGTQYLEVSEFDLALAHLRVPDQI